MAKVGNVSTTVTDDTIRIRLLPLDIAIADEQNIYKTKLSQSIFVSRSDLNHWRCFTMTKKKKKRPCMLPPKQQLTEHVGLRPIYRQRINGSLPTLRTIPDISKPFFVNGMEIDLGELEQFEKRLADKRQKQLQQPPQQPTCHGSSVSAASTSRDAVADDLDEYLDRLVIDIKARETAAAKHDEPDCDNTRSCSNRMVNTECDSVANGSSSGNDNSMLASSTTTTSLPLLLFSFFSILIFIQSVISNRKQVC